MQSKRQQLLLQLFNERPPLIETVLYEWLKVHLAYDAVAPRYSGAQIYAPASATAAPGNVFVLKDAQGNAAQLVVLQVLLDIDEAAKQSWPGLIWNLQAGQACKNVWLVVVAGDAQVADWARDPVATGPHWFAPVVLSPDRVPGVSDAGSPEEPEATLLAAALQVRNGSFPSQPDWAMSLLRAAASALRQLNSPHAADYHDMLAGPLFAIAATLLEEFSDKYWEGYRQGLAETVLSLLEPRFAQRLTGPLRAQVSAAPIERLSQLVKHIGSKMASPEAALEDMLTPLTPAHEDGTQALTARAERIQRFLERESPYTDEFVHWFCWRWARQDALSKLVLRQLRLKGAGLPAGAADRVLLANEAELLELGVALATQPAAELHRLLQPHADRTPLHRIGESFLTSPAIADPYKNEGGPWQRFLIARSAHDETQSSLVLRQLEARFGPLPAELASSLGREDGRDICAVGERLLSAKSLDEALGEPAPAAQDEAAEGAYETFE